VVAKRNLASERRSRKTRLLAFSEAVSFAEVIDHPLNTGITISWDVLINARYHNEGNCLGRNSRDRDRYARKELGRLCKREGHAFAALWGRDIGKAHGAHVHFSMFWPHYKIAKLVALLERITGSPAEFVNTPYKTAIVARSVCGGWQINLNNRPGNRDSAITWALYIAEQHDKHPTPPDIDGKAFGTSEAIGKAAQERARPMVEEKKALREWMKGRGAKGA
jgi:hypothetical protein